MVPMRPLEGIEKEMLSAFLRSDFGGGDPASEAIVEIDGKAEINCGRDCVLSGLEAVDWIFRESGCVVDFEDGAVSGGMWVGGKRLSVIEGGVREILRGERTALNILSRMSGIATAASKASDIARRASPGTRVAGTRKTTPGFGPFEKRALIDGGALPHRMNLSQLAMLKDNHISAAGSEGIKGLVGSIRERYGPYILIELEAEDPDTAMEGLDAGCDIIMLDNLPPERCGEISKMLKDRSRDLGRRVKIEASGGITMEDIADYAPHVDVISMGSLTYGYDPVGFSMDMVRINK